MVQEKPAALRWSCDVDDGSNDDRAFRIKREAADRLERHILERDVELGEVADNLLRQLIGWGE